MDNNIYLIGENGAKAVDIALKSMYERTEWKFPEPIEKFLKDDALLNGITLQGIDDVFYHFDDIYCHSPWGKIEDIKDEFDDEKDLKEYLEDACLWHDKVYYIEYL